MAARANLQRHFALTPSIRHGPSAGHQWRLGSCCLSPRWVLIPWMVAQFASLLVLPRRVALLALLTVSLLGGRVRRQHPDFCVRARRAGATGKPRGVACLHRPGHPGTASAHGPVVVWLLWKRPGLRIPAAAIFVIHAALVALTGYGGQWLQRLATSGDEIALTTRDRPRSSACGGYPSDWRWRSSSRGVAAWAWRAWPRAPT